MRFSLEMILLVLVAASTTGAARTLRGKAEPTTTAERTLSSSSSDDYVLRWASSGGGWRSMSANFGYTNAFAQAGLFDLTEASKFSAISTTSGASWFSSQLFYSEQAYNALVGGSPSDIYTFTADWMDTYVQLQEDVPAVPFCEKLAPLFSKIAHGANGTQVCELFVQYEGQWAGLVTSMLGDAAAGYGDSTFADRDASYHNRVSPLMETDLFFQTSLSANSIYFEGRHDSGNYSFIGPSTSSGEYFSVPIPTQYAIKDTSTFYNYGIHDLAQGTVLTNKRAPVPSKFELSDYDEFYLYPGTDGQVLTQVTNVDPVDPVDFATPFGGLPTVSQIASASSAAVGSYSYQNPSVTAQTMSISYYGIENSGLPPVELKEKEAEFNTFLATLAAQPLLYGVSVCSQYPSPCAQADGRFLDGSYSDGISLAMNIAQYQTIDQGDLSKTLKVIVTNNNYYTDQMTNFLVYFETDFNSGVAPGDFLWAPGTGVSAAGSVNAQAAPFRSQQIFEEYLDSDMIEATQEVIPGTNFTTGVYTATTIDNEALGVVAGQTVEVLFLNTNSNIPTFILGVEYTEQYVEPLAELAESLAGSQTLVDRIKAFLGE